MIHNFSYPVLENASEMIRLSKSGASKSRPRWAAHTRKGNVWEYPPPGLGGQSVLSGHLAIPRG